MRMRMNQMILLWDHLTSLKQLCSFPTTRTKVGLHTLVILGRPFLTRFFYRVYSG